MTFVSLGGYTTLLPSTCATKVKYQVSGEILDEAVKGNFHKLRIVLQEQWHSSENSIRMEEV